MTRELKALMDSETDRSDNYFSPDPAVILAAGRRRQRVRNLSIGATLMTVLVLLAGGLVVILPNHEAQVAGRPQDAYKQCDTSSGRRLGKNSWTWPEVVTLTDQYGSASLRRDPGNPSTIAFCVTQPKSPTGDIPLGHINGIVVRKTPISKQLSMTTVFGVTYAEAGGTVMVALGASAQLRFPGHLTPAYTAAAMLGQATIAGKYYVFRHTEDSAWPGPRPEVAVASYQMKGYIFSQGKW